MYKNDNDPREVRGARTQGAARNGGKTGARRWGLAIGCAVLVAASLLAAAPGRDASAQTGLVSPGQADVADRMLRLADTLAEMSIRMGNLFGGASDYKLYRLYAGKQMNFDSDFYSNLNAGWSLSGMGKFNVDERFGTFPDSVLAQVRSNLIALGPEATPRQIMAAAGAALGVPADSGLLTQTQMASAGGEGRILAAIGQSMEQLRPRSPADPGRGLLPRGPDDDPDGGGNRGGNGNNECVVIPGQTALDGEGNGLKGESCYEDSENGTDGNRTYGSDDGTGSGDDDPLLPVDNSVPQQFAAVTQVPEPGTLAVSGIGFSLLGFFAWRRRRKG